MKLILLLAVAVAAVVVVVGDAGDHEDHQCEPRSCGDLHNITYPFSLKGDPRNNCGHPEYELACENNRAILYLYDGIYYVLSINYHNLTMRVVDTDLQPHNCSSLPRHSLAPYNFTNRHPYQLDYSNYGPLFVFVNCEINGVVSPDDSGYVDTSTPCINTSSSTKNLRNYSSNHYVVWSSDPGDIKDGCTIEFMYAASSTPETRFSTSIKNKTYYYIHREMLKGVVLSWSNLLCLPCFHRGREYYCDADTYQLNGHSTPFSCHRYCKKSSRSIACFVENSLLVLIGSFLKIGNILHVTWYDGTGYGYSSIAKTGTVLVFVLAGRTACGILCMLAYLIYKFRRRHLSMDESLEKFLQNNHNLMPIRYSYSEIRKMTKGFKNKLGQGGFSSVFLGKLQSGRSVAVKMLVKSKTNGQDFINEVATIGRIHHVNIVRLTGFCVEGTKKALVYDFMPNGSLEKYIFPGEEGGNCLSWGKLYEIAMGVARGIEYLHRGCNMQILHFDIKPHNILLDDKFIPKVSDFGLAKLYPVDHSIVSLTAARGTLGYMAPELFYKKIGGVSYKADVYSFGMLLMEMVGRRKNVNRFAENSSQIYFPAWIYDRFNQGDEMDIGDAGEGEKKIVRKLILIALWCIQMMPADRPSMGRVIEMLEGPVELLQVPPKPFLYSPENMGITDNATGENGAGPSSTTAHDESESLLSTSDSLETIPLNVSVC